MISRYRIIQIHMLLAASLLPFAIIYFLAGALYSLDIKGTIQKQVFSMKFEQPLAPNLDQLEALVTKELLKRKLSIPNGEATLKKKKGLYKFRWNSLEYVATLVISRDAHSASLTFRTRSLLTRMMRIHRAEAGPIFKTVSIILVVGLIFIFGSGIYMAQSIPKFRRPMAIAIFSGTAVFLVLLLMH